MGFKRALIFPVFLLLGGISLWTGIKLDEILTYAAILVAVCFLYFGFKRLYKKLNGVVTSKDDEIKF